MVGGNLLLLQRCSSMLQGGMPFADVKQQLFSFVEMTYVHAGLLDASPQQHGGLAAIEALLASKGCAIPTSGARPRRRARLQGSCSAGRPGPAAPPRRDCTRAPRLLCPPHPLPPEWRECVPEWEHQRMLLTHGVLSFDGQRLCFASNLARHYAAEQLGGRLAPSVRDKHKRLRR